MQTTSRYACVSKRSLSFDTNSKLGLLYRIKEMRIFSYNLAFIADSTFFASFEIDCHPQRDYDEK